MTAQPQHSRQGPTTAITLYERDDGKRSIGYGAGKDRVVIAEDGTRHESRAVEVVRLSGDLSFEEIRRAYARADSISGRVSGWLSGGAGG